MDMVAWLRSLGLGQYERVFHENAIDDADVLCELTEADLEKLGVLLGHRKRILKAVAALRGASESEPLTGAVAERRHLTVLFCDLVGSTSLSARLDPEELRAALDSYRRAVAAAVERGGGYVAKYMGDGVLAYFGWPRVREDDAECAIRAGLAAVAAVGTIHNPVEPLAARVGIATGSVIVGDVVGEGEARERAVTGDAPNLAARLQALAGPGEVIVDVATRQLTGALFECEDLGDVPVKGLPAPVRAWRALGEGVTESRFEALRGRLGGDVPLLGRDEELGTLLRRWAKAKRGEGQVVLLNGEPGIGKSRLIAALQDALAGEDHEILLWFCSPHRLESALHPVIARLERAAGFKPGEAVGEKLVKVEALLASEDSTNEEVALMADLLSVPGGEQYPVPDFSPQRQRERMLATLLRRFETLARRRPVLAVLEDAHWADPTTRELVDLLAARLPDLPALLVVTHRPEFEAPWVGQAHVAELRISRLVRRDSEALLVHIAGGKPLPPELVEQIVAKADGVPLFAEELTRTVLEGSLLREGTDCWVLDGPLPPLAVPSTLQGSLLARLDRLSPVREVAQAGAALGREFEHDLLAEVAGVPAPRLRDALAQLIASGLMQARGQPPEVVYAFKHALMRDAAYGTLLRERRQILHQRAAEALERLRAGTAERDPQLLAHHYAQAGIAERAVRCWIEAAEQALARSALAEAEATPRRALELLPDVMDETERARLEIDLQLLLARRHMAARGYGAPDARSALDRALVLCDQAADDDRRNRTLAVRWVYEHVSGRPRSALAVGELLLSGAEHRGDTSGMLIGHYGCGMTLVQLGRLTEARAHLEAARVLGEHPDSARYALAPGHLVTAAARIFLAAVMLLLGEPERAAAMSSEAIEVARQRGDPFTLTFVLCVAARLHLQARDDTSSRGLLHEAQRIADAKGISFYQNLIRMNAGLLLSRDGHPREGARAIRICMDAHARNGALWQLPLFSTLLVEALMAAGMHEEAVRAVDDGLRASETNEDRDSVAELLRLRGRLHEQAGDRAAAQVDFEAAISLARQQRAKLWELRAATSLARLWRDQGRRAEAHDLLAPLYASFNEGSSLPDFAEAKVLLDELASTAAASPINP